MRLYNIYYICKNTLDSIKELKYTEAKVSNIYRIDNWETVREGLIILKAIPFLAKYIDNIFECVPIYSRKRERPQVDTLERDKIIRLMRDLVARTDTVIELYESMEKGEAKEGIDIKIPECDSFKEYIQYMKDIDFIFSQSPFISKSKEEIVFNTVDVGSIWLSFFVKATAGAHVILNILSKMSEMAIKIKSNSVVIKQQEEMLKTMQQKNEIGSEVIDVFKKLKENILDDAVSELEVECNLSVKEPEDRDRARRTLEKYAELIDKGVEIYCAIETPTDIKVQFPFSDNAPEIPEGLLKLIEEKKENEKETIN
ncbi:MAG: hypothetical protein HDT30_11170 [Clostridiales bacterium]|nr:hypothetical protein [Clostridiales bacterium]